MSETVLDKIVKYRREDIARLKIAQPLASFEAELHANDRDFYAAIEGRKNAGLPAYILECKRSSPSQGVIREDFDLPKLSPPTILMPQRCPY